MEPSRHTKQAGARSLLNGTERRTAALALLMMLALIAGLSRFAGLDHLLVWHDEVFTLLRVFGYPQALVEQTVFSGQLLSPADVLRFQTPDAARGWADTLRALTEHPEHPPLYYLIARLATELPLDPITAVRGTAAVFGFLLIPASFWMTRALFGRGSVAWVAAALVAVSPVELLFSQEARQYSLWLLLLTLSSGAFVKALETDRARYWALYGISVSLGLYSHLLFLVILPVHAAYLALFSMSEATQRRHLARRTRAWSMTIAAAVASFSPWIWVIVTHSERAARYTGWMNRPIGPWAELSAWAGHLSRAFVDSSPTQDAIWKLLLIPLAWLLARFVRRAPKPAGWLLPLMGLAYLGVVIGPDMLNGGSRSLHARYALPAVFAVQLMVAWVIGSALDDSRRTLGRVAMVGLGAVLGLGLMSQAAIQGTETWSTKNFSERNAAVARIANAAEQGLVLASESQGIGLGELISLAYHLKPDTQIIGEPRGGAIASPTASGPAIILGPTDAILSALGPSWRAEPIPGTWHWFRAVPAK